MDTEMRALSASELADLVGVTKAEVDRLVGLGILVARGGAGPFLETDVQKVRLATACERAGLPMEGIASAVRAGRLSFAFLEAAPYRRWAVRSARTYRQVSQETGVPLELLGGALEAMGFARMAPDESIREDELAVVPLLQLGHATGVFDLAWLTRLGRAHAEGLRLIAMAWGDAYQARFEGPALESGASQQTAMERAAQLSVDFLPLTDPALLAIYHRQQELVWTEGLVERIEHELERAGVLGRPGRVPAMCFLDLVGYTQLTEERGDAAAAVLAALRLVEQLPEAGLPPAHVGVAAGPVVAQGGDYFGRTVNLAARIATHANAGQVLVSGSVAEAASPEGVSFVELGELRLEGFAGPVRLLEARRA